MDSHSACWKPHSSARGRKHSGFIFPDNPSFAQNNAQPSPCWGQRRHPLEMVGMESAVAGSSVGSSWVKLRSRWSQCLEGKALLTQGSTHWNSCHPSSCRHRGLRGKMLHPALSPWSFTGLGGWGLVQSLLRSQRRRGATGSWVQLVKRNNRTHSTSPWAWCSTWTNHPENLSETLDTTKRAWAVSPSCSDQLHTVCGSGDLYFHSRYLCLLFFYFLQALWITQGAICGAEITSDQTFSRFFCSLGAKTRGTEQISQYFLPHKLYPGEGRVEVH